MITCTSCGHANDAGDSFCGSCSTFLEWEGAAAPVARPVPLPVPVGGPAGTQTEAPAPDPAPVPDVRTPEAEQRREPPRRTHHDGGPTDLYCGACGTGNATGRHYCRRCGGVLADPAAPPQEHLGWWQRLVTWFRGLRRRPDDTTLAVGERPERWGRLGATPASGGRRRRFRIPTRISLGKLALPLAILSVFGMGIAPVRAKATALAFDGYESVRRVVAPRYVPVTPVAAKADSEQADHPAGAAIDQNTETHWAEGRRGTLATLTSTFDQPIDVARIGFHAGAPGKQFPLQPRPRRVHVVLTAEGSPTVTKDIELADTRDFQVFEVEARDVTAIALTVESVYSGQRGTAVAVSEVQFVAKQ
jgi:hypothetical protein